MHITCVICSDLITASDDTFVTNCGHLFHYNCVIQWLERAKTCPQCRSKTSEKNIHRVYFNVANIDGADDPSSLQNKIDNMKFQFKLKDLDLKNSKEANSELTSKNKALRDEIKDLEDKLASANTAISSLKGQIRNLKVQNQRMDELRSENKMLQDRLNTMEGLQTIRIGSAADVDELLDSMVGSSAEARSLATYCSALKRELQGMVEKRKLTQDRMKEYSNNLSRAYAERDSLKEALREKVKEEAQLKEELSHATEDCCRLEQKFKEWGGYFDRVQSSGGKSSVLDVLSKLVESSPSKENTATEMLRLLTESPAPEELLAKIRTAVRLPKIPNPTIEIEVGECSASAEASKQKSSMKSPKRPMLSDPTIEDETPKRVRMTMLTESQHRPDTKNTGFHKKSFSIFQKPRLCSKPEESLQEEMGEVYYDGMGGHKRTEIYPNPKRPKLLLGAKPKMKRAFGSQGKTALPSIENFLDNFPS